VKRAPEQNFLIFFYEITNFQLEQRLKIKNINIQVAGLVRCSPGFLDRLVGKVIERA